MNQLDLVAQRTLAMRILDLESSNQQQQLMIQDQQKQLEDAQKRLTELEPKAEPVE